MYLACITIRAKCVYCVIVRVSFVLKLILNSMFCDAVIIMYTRLLLLCAHGCYYYVHTVVIIMYTRLLLCTHGCYYVHTVVIIMYTRLLLLCTHGCYPTYEDPR